MMSLFKPLRKRGIGQELPEQLVYLVFTLAVIFGIIFLLDLFVNSSVESRDLQANVIFYRAMSSPESIIYQDAGTGKIYPGVIDLEKFSSDMLENSINYSYEKHIAARISLYNFSGETPVPLKTIYLNEHFFKELLPRTKIILSSNPPKRETYTTHIIYRTKEGENKPGYIEVDVIVPG